MSDVLDRLCRNTHFDAAGIAPPDPSWYDLPEKVLQFGTGAFLRGFSNVYVDRALRDGRFGGRIVVVGSTGSGRSQKINEQDGLYTLSVQGVENGETVDRCTVVGSVSRALASTEEWDAVRHFARSPDLDFVISNTTEVGIRFDPDDRPGIEPPASFPGKLTALLHDRARAFDYDPSHGLTILCCELIEDNADRLRDIVLQLSERWALGEAFAEWITRHNRFCNTLVDRIVPGRPDAGAIRALEERLGYSDDLVVQAEPFSFWAIEGDEALLGRLGFLDGEDGVVVTPDIAPYRTRKVRILNGAHSASVPLSFLCGNDTVAETMEDALTADFVRHIVLEEIVPNLDVPDAESFAHTVLDRFANPFVHHELMSIALHQTSKMDVRVVPSILAYHKRTGRLPDGLTMGFAAFLFFVTRQGRAANASFHADERGEVVRGHWDATGPNLLEAFVAAVCGDGLLWSRPLDKVPGFVAHVAKGLRAMHIHGVRKTLESTIVPINTRN